MAIKQFGIALAILAAQTWVVLAAAETKPDAAESAEALRCTTRAENFVKNVVTCPLSATGKTQNLRFQANFSGGHDDTKASMVPRLDAQPLSCDNGGKLDLFSEEGDVSLECRFTIQADSRPHVLEVTISWSHAEYTNAELKAM
jgi:hypothetical protein